MLCWFSYTVESHLPRGAAAHSELGAQLIISAPPLPDTSIGQSYLGKPQSGLSSQISAGGVKLQVKLTRTKEVNTLNVEYRPGCGGAHISSQRSGVTGMQTSVSLKLV